MSWHDFGTRNFLSIATSDAPSKDGVARSSDETAVMAAERRPHTPGQESCQQCSKEKHGFMDKPFDMLQFPKASVLGNWMFTYGRIVIILYTAPPWSQEKNSLDLYRMQPYLQRQPLEVAP